MKNNFRNCLTFNDNKLFSSSYTLYHNYKNNDMISEYVTSLF